MHMALVLLLLVQNRLRLTFSTVTLTEYYSGGCQLHSGGHVKSPDLCWMLISYSRRLH